MYVSFMQIDPLRERTYLVGLPQSGVIMEFFVFVPLRALVLPSIMYVLGMVRTFMVSMDESLYPSGVFVLVLGFLFSLA